jgi:hypothetical protein
MDDLSDPAVVKEACVRGLAWGLEHVLPSVEIDRRGDVSPMDDNLLPELLYACGSVLGDWFDDLLEDYMRAVHSSAALAVNSFAPLLLEGGSFSLGSHSDLQVESFERGSNDPDLSEPHLDIRAKGPAGAVVIVPSCIDYVLRHVPPPWARQTAAALPPERMSTTEALPSAPQYHWLDTERLIQCARRRANDGAPVTVIYLYWEPMDACLSPLFEEHRQEIAAFAKRMAVESSNFEALSFFELWNGWAESGTTRLQKIASALRERYEVPAWAWEGVSWVDGRLNNSGLEDW